MNEWLKVIFLSLLVIGMWVIGYFMGRYDR